MAGAKIPPRFHITERGERVELLIDICSSDQERSDYLEKMLQEYMRTTTLPIEYRCYLEIDLLKESLQAQMPHILILAMDDIDNQETGVWVRQLSKGPRIIWIGEDKRFGLSSYRISTTNFLLYPPKLEEFIESIWRCLGQLNKPRQGPLK